MATIARDPVRPARQYLPCGSHGQSRRFFSSKSAQAGTWGGARANSGGARANSGGARPGAGRKPATPPPAPPDGPRWHCVHTHPHSELTADTEIRLAGFTVFSPTLWKPSEPPRRDSAGAMRPGKPDRVAPLFPRYLFVQFSRADRWQRIPFLPGVAGILSSAPDRPTPIADEAIEVIKALLAPNGCLYPPTHHAPPFAIGATARLLQGPMAELTGLCTWSDGRRVRVLLEIMGRPVPVTVAQSAVEAV